MAVNYSLRVQSDNRFRFWISIFTFLISVLLVADDTSTDLLLTVCVFLTYTAFYGLGHYAAKHSNVGPVMHYALLAIDCLTVTAIIWVTGGLRSPLYFLYLTVFGVCLYQRDLASFIFSNVFSLCLFAWLLVSRSAIDRSTPFEIAGHLVLIGSLTAILFVLMLLMQREQKQRDRLVSRAKTLAEISDVLSGSLSNSRDWIKNVLALIEVEVSPDGIECRITIHKGDHQFMPPSHGSAGAHIPVMVGEYIFGALIVRRPNETPLNANDLDFFSSVARSLGLALHRAKLWEDLQKKIQKLSASSSQTPASVISPSERSPENPSHL